MNYKRIYDSLISRAQSRIIESYTESHHIVPRCMGGTDDKDNLVCLTPEEHYVAHQLLTKIHPDNYKLALAASMMTANRPSNKVYGWLKRRHAVAMSECQSGKGNSQHGTMWITNGIEDAKTVSEIPEGWQRGRVSSYIAKEKRLKAKEAKLEARVKELRELHEVYKLKGFAGVKQAGYKYSKPNLVQAFAKFLPEFVSQNGKKRIIP